jgi:hypothetical protein
MSGALKLDDLEGAVTVAYIHQNDCTMSWHHSIIEMVAFDMMHEGRVARGGWIAIHCGTGNLGEARNEAVETFLKEGKADWMYWSDTDMGFEADHLDRLFQAADAKERPMVGALCFSMREFKPDGKGGFETWPTPTIFDWATIEGQQGYSVRWDYPENTLVRCAGTGSAAVLIHRSVFEAVAKANGRVWYDRIRNTTTGQLIGEDLSFCLRVGALNIPIHVLTNLEASHAKLDWIGSRQYKERRAIQKAAEGSAEKTAVIVPVMGRPQNAAPFMESLKASTDKATVYAIVGPEKEAGKSAVAWQKAGAQVRVTQGSTFAEKVNAAYKLTTEPWLLLVGDDVRFHSGWLEAAQKVGAVASVVGTNDLANPRVLAGEHTCHPLIKRSYIDKVGASWDGPGIVAHEYGHWFVDDEIVTAAKKRGVWGFAKDAVIEHLHPLWGKAGDDEIYRLGQSKAEADQALFKERLEKYVPEALLVDA